MSHTRCQLFNWLLYPLIAMVTAVVTMDLGIIELYMLWSYTVLVTVAHIEYGVAVVS